MNNNLEEYLNNYNPDDFKRPSITVDTVMLTIGLADGYMPQKVKKSNEKLCMKVLLGQRTNEPYKGQWALPGTFVDMNEDLDASVKRLLHNKLGIENTLDNNIHYEQLYTFGDVERDPRMRIISVGYIVIVDDYQSLELHAGESIEKLKWFDLSYKADNIENTLKFISDDMILPTDEIAFDHRKIIAVALQRIINKVEYTDIAFSFLPEEFTLGEVQSIYECILDTRLDKSNFRKFIKKFVIPLDKTEKNVGHRPAKLFMLDPNWMGTPWR